MRNWTCMSTQPSSSRRFASSGTSSTRVRNGSTAISMPPSLRYASCTETTKSRSAVPRAARGAEHVAGRRRQRHGHAQPAGEVLRQHEVLLLQLDVGEHGGVVDEQRRPVADHRRGDDALEDGVHHGRAVDAGLLDERDALGERRHRRDQREVDRDLREDRVAVRPDVGDLRADRVQDRRDVVEGLALATDHHRHLAGRERGGAAGDRAVEEPTRRSPRPARRARRWRPARSC